MRELNKIPSENKVNRNFFEDILDSIFKVLGITKTNNLYSELFSTASEIIKSEADYYESRKVFDSLNEGFDTYFGTMTHLHSSEKVSFVRNMDKLDIIC